VCCGPGAPGCFGFRYFSLLFQQDRALPLIRL
jgi:hypothetical protein